MSKRIYPSDSKENKSGVFSGRSPRQATLRNQSKFRMEEC